MANLKINIMQSNDIQGLDQAFGHGDFGFSKPIETWHLYWTEQVAQKRTVAIAWQDDRVVGYGTLLTNSKYKAFAADGIPEINDLNVIAPMRRQGVATQLIVFLEKVAVDLGYSTVGIGVGLYADYGSAQRRYVKLGYVPDGLGVAYDGQPVAPGTMVRVDDDLNVFFKKDLAPRP